MNDEYEGRLSDLVDWTDSLKKALEIAAEKEGVTIDEILARLLRNHVLEILAGSSSELVALPLVKESRAVQEIIDDMLLSRFYNKAPGMTEQEMPQWIADAIQKARKIAGE